MLKLWRKLNEMGVMGINTRNLDYISQYNPRKLFPLVDNKILTKTLAMKNGIQVPELYLEVSSESMLPKLVQFLQVNSDCAIKPAHGAGGDGIIILTNRRNSRFRKITGDHINLENLLHHVSNILSGLYSLGGSRDSAMVEYRIQSDPILERITYQGVPDLRIITLLGFPIMAMLRLPTKQSDGKANLHQGAVGVGIDLASGTTMEGVWQNEIIDIHPDSGHTLSGLVLPHWEKCLEIAASCYELTGMGYLGVDLVLDKSIGPMMLELNARPGLNIQIANHTGLLRRCTEIEAFLRENGQIPCKDRIAFSQIKFANVQKSESA